MNHATVGTDLQGDHCIYVQKLKVKDGELAHVKYLSEKQLQKIADALNAQEGWTE